MLPSVAIIINLTLIGLLIRQRHVRYSRWFKLPFMLLFIFNAIITVTRMGIEMTTSADVVLSLSMVGFVAGTLFAIVICGVATRLYRPASEKPFIQDLIIYTLKYPPFLATIVWGFSTIALALIFTPFSLEGTFLKFEPWFAAWIGAAVIWVLVYSHTLLFKFSRKQEAVGRRYATILIAAFGSIIIFYAILSFVGPYIRGLYNIEYLVTILPMAAMAYTLRVPTVLEQVVPAIEVPLPGPPKFKLGAGRSFMAKGDPAHIYEIFADRVKHGAPGLLITKLDPKKVAERYKLEKTPIVCVTFRESKKAISPGDMGGLEAVVSDFMGLFERSVVLLGCFYELKLVNGFDQVLETLKKLKKVASTHNSNLLISVDPNVLTSKQLGKLERVLEGVGV